MKVSQFCFWFHHQQSHIDNTSTRYRFGAGKDIMSATTTTSTFAAVTEAATTVLEFLAPIMGDRNYISWEDLASLENALATTGHAAFAALAADIAAAKDRSPSRSPIAQAIDFALDAKRLARPA